MQIGLWLIGFLCAAAGFAMAGDLSVGDEAPAFQLPGSDGTTYQLSDYDRKQVVVLAWFPKAFTGG